MNVDEVMFDFPARVNRIWAKHWAEQGVTNIPEIPELRDTEDGSVQVVLDRMSGFPDYEVLSLSQHTLDSVQLRTRNSRRCVTQNVDILDKAILTELASWNGAYGRTRNPNVLMIGESIRTRFQSLVASTYGKHGDPHQHDVYLNFTPAATRMQFGVRIYGLTFNVEVRLLATGIHLLMDHWGPDGRVPLQDRRIVVPQGGITAVVMSEFDIYTREIRQAYGTSNIETRRNLIIERAKQWPGTDVTAKLTSPEVVSLVFNSFSASVTVTPNGAGVAMNHKSLNWTAESMAKHIKDMAILTTIVTGEYPHNLIPADVRVQMDKENTQ